MFKTIEDIKRAVKADGNDFFSPDTMRYFRSRVHEQIYTDDSGAYFVTSEKASHRHRRLYTVRRCNADGSIDTVGEFQGYSDRRSAHRAAKALANK